MRDLPVLIFAILIFAILAFVVQTSAQNPPVTDQTYPVPPSVASSKVHSDQGGRIIVWYWNHNKTIRTSQFELSQLDAAARHGHYITKGEVNAWSQASTRVLRALPQSVAASPSPAWVPHRFWDRENDWLFAGLSASRALDYASTLNIRRRGLNEAFLTNQIVDNHPLFAGIEVGATGASIGVSYLFHRTGHHRLEHWVSIVHMGVATGGAIRNYALKTPRS